MLTAAALVDAGLVSPDTRINVPAALPRPGEAPLTDYFPHGRLRLTMTGVIAKSSNIGTVLAARQMKEKPYYRYLRSFGLGAPTGLGVEGESAGVLPKPKSWGSLTKDTISFGQGVAVSAVQMAAAVNTIANGGVYVQPSLVKGRATTSAGVEVGTDTAGRHRVVSEEAAAQVAQMMEAVTDLDEGTAPRRRDPRLPRRRQDRHRAAGRRDLRLLRRHLHRLVRRLRAGRRPALRGLRRRAEPHRRRWRRLGRRPGVPQDHDPPAAEVRRPADRLGRPGPSSSGDGAVRRHRPRPRGQVRADHTSLVASRLWLDPQA